MALSQVSQVIVNNLPANASSIELSEIAGTRVSDTDMNHKSGSAISGIAIGYAVHKGPPAFRGPQPSGP